MTTDGLRHEQIVREKAQRDAALGRRAKLIADGDMGPVLRRWVNGAVEPTTKRVRAVADAWLEGDTDQVAALLDSPTFGLPVVNARQNALLPLLGWCLKGSSPGRSSGRTTYAEDLVLACMGSVLMGLASDRKQQGAALTTTLVRAAQAIRETVLGQWLSTVQTPAAVEKIRRKGKGGKQGKTWHQVQKLNTVAAMMMSSVLPQLQARDRGEVVLGELGSKTIVKVTDPHTKHTRQLTLRECEPDDWLVLDMARHVKGEKDVHAETWMSFAMLIICAAQVESGWFELTGKMRTAPSAIVSVARKRRVKDPTRWLVLSEDAFEAIAGDIERWIGMGFVREPMVHPPEEGDYLTVKHREVTGRRGPMGVRTEARESDAWSAACEVLAATPWTVPAHTLKAIRESTFIREVVAKSVPSEVARETIIGSYRRLATSTFYFPVMMDFRGRLSPRTTWVTYQGGDLQKGLLAFAPGGDTGFMSDAAAQALNLHTSALYGLDKAPLKQREAWCYDNLGPAGHAILRGEWEDPALGDLLTKADEPIQLLTAVGLIRHDQHERVPCQIDGTCNGLQHLTALFRDEVGAKAVNLTASTLDDHPFDIYEDVATRVRARLDGIPDAWASRIRAAVTIDRKLCKRPTMVLPYGGTRTTIADTVLASILDQGPDPTWWTECRATVEGEVFVTDEEATANNYLAFADRELWDHPLLHRDARMLGQVVWECITEVIPKAMLAMDALRKVGTYVGGRSLEWAVGMGERPLWVVQAKPKSARVSSKFRGFHLPAKVRGLGLVVGKDEVDVAYQRTGIVANFIHSQDAGHLAATMSAFRGLGGTAFGSIHDCFLGRPSEMADLNLATRAAFAETYAADPLAQPVRIRDLKSGEVESFPSWYDLAAAAGASFPPRGTWDVDEVRESAWFFC